MSTAPTTEAPARQFPLEHGTYKLEVLNLEMGESPDDFRGEVHVIGGAHAGRKCWVNLPGAAPRTFCVRS